MSTLRLFLFTLPLAALLAPPSALAGLRSPDRGCGLPPPPVCWNRSSLVVAEPRMGCQYEVLPGPFGERLVLQVTLRDSFDNPVAGWPVEAELAPEAGAVVCGCQGLVAGGVSGPAGDVELAFGLLGGRGALTVDVTVFHPDHGTPFPVGGLTGLAFSSADQNATCAPVGPAADVVDLGIWAQGLPPSPYLETSDLNCDGTVNIIDLGRFATGLHEGCAGE